MKKKDLNKKNTSKKTKTSRLLDVLLVVFILIFLGSGGYLIHYYYTINKSEQSFSELADLIVEDDMEPATPGDSEVDENGNPLNQKPKYVEVDGEMILARYSELYKKNKDLAGWLRIPDTPIDYPVMFTPEDPEHYLRRDFDGNYSISGTLFIDERNDLKEFSDNTIIYGHHMKSGTMFGSLQKYEDEKFFQEHKYIYFDTIYEKGTYEVIAAFKTQIYEKNYKGFVFYDFINAETEQDFTIFVDQVQRMTPYDSVGSVHYGDKLLSLSTCAYHVENGRYVVIAKKID